MQITKKWLLAAVLICGILAAIGILVIQQLSNQQAQQQTPKQISISIVNATIEKVYEGHHLIQFMVVTLQNIGNVTLRNVKVGFYNWRADFIAWSIYGDVQPSQILVFKYPGIASEVQVEIEGERSSLKTGL